MHPKEDTGSYPVTGAAGCAPSSGACPEMQVAGRQARGFHCGKQAPAAPRTQYQPELGATSDACLVTLTPALEAGVSGISLEGTVEVVALFLLPFFCLGPGVASASLSHPQWVSLLRAESTTNSFHAWKIISWLMKKQNFNEIKVLCENPMDRSQHFLRDSNACSTSLPAHVLAFKIICKQVPELMESVFLCTTKHYG